MRGRWLPLKKMEKKVGLFWGKLFLPVSHSFVPWRNQFTITGVTISEVKDEISGSQDLQGTGSPEMLPSSWLPKSESQPWPQPLCRAFLSKHATLVCFPCFEDTIPCGLGLPARGLPAPPHPLVSLEGTGGLCTALQTAPRPGTYYLCALRLHHHLLLQNTAGDCISS